MDKFKVFILLFLVSFSSFSQFDDEVSKIQLFDMASDMKAYGYTIVKDKIFLINNIEKKLSANELDYALAKVEEYLVIMDMNIKDSEVKKRLRSVKTFWFKFNQKVTNNMLNSDFSNINFEINNWDRLVSDLQEAMKSKYKLPLDYLKIYDEIQLFRILINKTSTSYLANLLKLNKSLIHEYQKNINQSEDFIKRNSNKILNNVISGQYFPEIILDWNFYKKNLYSKINHPKTVFVLSISIDYHLKLLKDKYIITN